MSETKHGVVGTRKHFSMEHSTHASRHTLWRVWTDLETWQHWDEGLASASSHDALALGVKGVIVPNLGLRSPFEVTEWNPVESYTIATRLIGATLHVRRDFVEGPETRFRHNVWFSGRLAFIWATMLGGGFHHALPTTMKKLAAFAEDLEASAKSKGVRP